MTLVLGGLDLIPAPRCTSGPITAAQAPFGLCLRVTPSLTRRPKTLARATEVGIRALGGALLGTPTARVRAERETVK